MTIIKGSLKKDKYNNTREHKDFPRGNHKGENTAKIPQYII